VDAITEADSQRERFLAGLETLYRRESQDLEPERPVWNAVFDLLFDELLRPRDPRSGARYRLEEALGLGTTSVVWKVYDGGLEAYRALKILRPSEARRDQGVKVARAEPGKLAALDHPNIIRVYSAGELRCSVAGQEYHFPYFFMTFIEDLRDLDKLTTDDHLAELSGDKLLEYVHQVASALHHLHSKDIVHCDLKPANIFVAPGYGALIGDLGYAKYLRKSQSGTVPPVPTAWYAHPELLALLNGVSSSQPERAEIPREKLREAFDLFAFGRSLLQILHRLKQAESVRSMSLFTRYQWSYLTIIAKRLLDGQRKPAGGQIPEELASPELLPGMSDDVIKELAYRSAQETVEDIQKLLHLFDLEGKVPELEPDIRTYVQIPLAKTPLTPRVETIINHPNFSRLARVSQLGFVSLVYPGATHTRFEHSLGTLAGCCRYIRALWYDTENPLFQSIMSEYEVGLVLLAALLHDVGQYPMAHDLAEVDRRFAHEEFTEPLLRLVPDGEVSLEDVIWQQWGYRAKEVLDVLAPAPTATFRHRLLNALINGPADCDKLDYLPRDSTHLGINAGLNIDVDRLLRHATVVQLSRADSRSDVEVEQDVDIGVAEKVLSLAVGVLRTRDDMFAQVYWHHSVRALKAMLAYAVRGVLISRNDANAFWETFTAFAYRCSLEGVLSQSLCAREPTCSAEQVTVLADIAYSAPDRRVGALLAASDDALISLLCSFAPPAAQNMLRAIRTRNFYSRMITMRADVEAATYENVYDWYRQALLDGEHEKLEQQRLDWELAILELANKVGRGRLSEPQMLGLGNQLEQTRRLADQTHSNAQPKAFGNPDYLPVILFDVPVKATSRRTPKAKIWYLKEAKFQSKPETKSLEWDLGGKEFDKRVGKIRLLAHPDWKDLIQACVTEKDLRQIFQVK
jgi:serine/threonine protein kinase